MTAATDAPAPTRSFAAPASTSASPAGMSHRQILEALSGLLLAMFVAMLSGTVVSNALPRIVGDLHGSETSYPWVVTATLLTLTASTPLWGKLSDLVNRKLLMQIAICIYIFGSLFAGLSQSTSFLIACRAVQGVGAGGILALTQVILAAMVSPRERGRYSGYLGAVFAIATISGPLLGGVIVDTSWLGWRWCFYVGVPFAAAALIVLQKTLHLPTLRREGAKVDYLGAALIVAGVSLLLIWVSLAGSQFAWASGQTAAMVAGGVVLLALAVLVELRVKEPIIPLGLFRHRTITLATIASLFVGVALYGATIFLSQYFQISRGKSPTESGLLTMPLILGLALSSLVVGRIITKTGRWKRFLVLGAALTALGFGLLGTIRFDTSGVLVAIYMAIAGVGVGMTMQNLVLSVQNTVSIRELGSATATVSFFRSLGGAIGVSALGAVLASHVRSDIASGLTAQHIPAGSMAGSDTLPNPATLPPAIRTIVESAYGRGTAGVFLIATPLLVLAFLAVLAIREVPLRTTNVDGGEAAAVAAPVEAASALTSEIKAAPASAAETGPALRGRVTDPSGTPLSEVRVALVDSDGGTAATAVSDGQGTFALTAPAGNYLLLTSSELAQPTATRFQLADRPEYREVSLETTGVLVGRVRHAADAAAAPDARIVVTDPAGTVLGSAVSADDGAFLVDGLRSGEVLVVAELPTGAPLARQARITAGSRTLVTLDLPSGGVLTGVVRAGTDGRALPDAHVALFDARGVPFAAATTDGEGRYSFVDVPAGDYTLTATGFGPVSRQVSTATSTADTSATDIELCLGVSPAADPATADGRA